MMGSHHRETFRVADCKMTYLPDDIWYMICTQLWHQRDSFTLFNCACSGKQLATMALTNLYRYATYQDLKRHGLIWSCVGNLAPVADCDSDEDVPARDKCGRMEYHVTRLAQEKQTRGKKLSRREQYVKKWASLWRTIILSSLGKTLYPYSQYIRTLNLRNLEQLLLHSKFVDNIRKYIQVESFYFHLHSRKCRDFFQGDLAQFDVGSRFCVWDLLCAVAIINSIGEGESAQSFSQAYAKVLLVITKQTPLLEELTGKGNPPPHLCQVMKRSRLLQYGRLHYLDGSPDFTD